MQLEQESRRAGESRELKQKIDRQLRPRQLSCGLLSPLYFLRVVQGLLKAAKAEY
jgi:hypothetical protein